MTQIATVEELIRPGRVRIAVKRETACGHDCENCGGCGAGGGMVLKVEATDPLGTCPGDKVVVESSTGQVLSAAALVYLVPMATLIAGYALGASLGTVLHIGVTVLGFAAGLLPALWLDRRNRRRGGTTFRVVARV